MPAALRRIQLAISAFLFSSLALLAVLPVHAQPAPAGGSRAVAPASSTLNASADAYVSQAAPSRNYGTSSSLQVSAKSGAAKYAYIRFGVSGLATPVQSATLRVYSTTNSTTNGPAVYLAGNSWTESGTGGVNWNNKPGLLSAAVDNKAAIAKAAWVDYNVTSLVSGNGTYTFALTGDSSDNIVFSSREGGHPPQLVITLANTPTPAPTNTPTRIPSSTPTRTPTAAPTSTPTSAFTATSSPLPTPTDTASPTGTPTPSTAAATGTNTPTATSTAAATDTSTPALTATDTNTPTPTEPQTSTPTATLTSTPTSTPSATATPTLAAAYGIQHIFVVVMENHGYNLVWNTLNTPYITQLGNAYSRATNYYAVGHPSLPNYLELYGGSNFGITTDCLPSSTCHSTSANLADRLDAKGLTWKGYMETMPSPCYLSNSGNYAPKHDPFVYFDDIRLDSARCASHVVPFTALSIDLAAAATTPNYAFITPDLCSDMHDCTISTGDTWLQNHLPSILTSPACTVDKCLLILTWDEDDGHESNHVLTIFAGSAAQTNGFASLMPYNHYSLLRTVEDIFGLPYQTANDAGASPMTDLLK